MAVTNYMTVNGKIRSEHRSGESHARDFMHDPSGNVIGVYVNGWLNADACYMPWGATLASWNMDSSYKFTWMGGWDYRQTDLEWSSTYVRARHYSHRDGAWTTRDPLWPSEMPYGYVDGRVIVASDYYGFSGKEIDQDCPTFCSDIAKIDYSRLEMCMSRKGYGSTRDLASLRQAYDNLLNFCNGSKRVKIIHRRWPKNPDYDVEKSGSSAYLPSVIDDDSITPDCIEYFERNCNGPGAVSFVISPTAMTIDPPLGQQKCFRNTHPCITSYAGEFDCVVISCNDTSIDWLNEGWCKELLPHELTHCGGVFGKPGHSFTSDNQQADFVYVFGCCLRFALGSDKAPDACMHRLSGIRWFPK